MHFNIILPTLGRDSLAAAVDSVLNQSYKEWTLYIIGDGITVQKFDDERIICDRVHENRKDYGASARNFGIGITMKVEEPEWIAYIDDDDVWLSNHLETLSKMRADNPDANMVRTSGQSFKMKHKHPRSSKLVRKLGPVNSTDYLTVGMAHAWPIFRETDGWLPCDNHDHILWKQMLLAGGVAVESDVVTFQFRR